MSQHKFYGQSSNENKGPLILLLQSDIQEKQAVVSLIKSAIHSELPGAVIRTINNLYSKQQSSPEVINDSVSAADLVIGNMEGGNASVTFGLGMALAQNKPILLIAPSDRALSIPSELLRYRLFLFSYDEPELFVESVRQQIKNALQENLATSSALGSNCVFISYSHKDREFLDRLMIHLKPLDRAGLIKSWVDTNLESGDLWQHEIERALARARVAILLVSADFMASNFIIENELPPLLAKAAAGGTRIIPVIVKHCRFTRDKDLNRFQAVNEPGRPLISLSEAEREKIYDEIARSVEAAVGK
jgi:hypothetical protein